MRHNYSNRKDALRALRWDRVKKNKFLWFLFALSFVLSFLCPLLINYKYCDIFYPTENAVLTILSNISFGYLAGFIVYVLTTFLPETKRYIEINDNIYFRLYLLSRVITEIDEDIMPGVSEVKARFYENSVYNYLVKNANIEDLLDSTDHPTPPYINRCNYDRLSLKLSFIKDEIKTMVASYGREMESSTINKMLELQNLSDMFNNLAKLNIDFYNEDMLIIVISDITYKLHNGFLHDCLKYERFKYCKETIGLTNITNYGQ